MFMCFELYGVVLGYLNIKFLISIVDYIFCVLGVEYLCCYDFV